jgi:hypothetical protein
VHSYLEPLPGDVTTGWHLEADWWRLERPKCDRCGHHLACRPQLEQRKGQRYARTVQLSCDWCGTVTELGGGQ